MGFKRIVMGGRKKTSIFVKNNGYNTQKSAADNFPMRMDPCRDLAAPVKLHRMNDSQFMFPLSPAVASNV